MLFYNRSSNFMFHLFQHQYIQFSQKYTKSLHPNVWFTPIPIPIARVKLFGKFCSRSALRMVLLVMLLLHVHLHMQPGAEGSILNKLI